MSIFIDPSKIYQRFKILVFGSYHPNYIAILDRLVENIRKVGFKQTNLVKELTNSQKKSYTEESKRSLISDIEKEMKNSDFNIFLLFPDENDSVIGEFTWLVRSAFYEEKQEKVLLLMPFDYDHTVVVDIIEHKKVNCYRYNSEIDMQQKCIVFIKTNLVF